MLHIFGVIVFHRSLVNWNWGALDMCILLYVKLIWCSGIPQISGQLEEWWPCYMCILLYVKLLWCSGIPCIYGQLGGTSALHICAFCYMLHIFGVIVFHRSLVNWNWGALDMCILLYVKLLWCSGIPCIYGQLGGTSALHICAFCYMLHIFGVIVFHRSLVNWNWGALDMCILLYVKFLMVLWYSIDLWSIGRGTSALSICAFFYILNVFGVVVFHRSVVNCRSRTWYMYILLYGKRWWCRGIPKIYGQLEGGTSAPSICAFCYM